MLYEEKHSHKRFWIAIGCLIALCIFFVSLFGVTYDRLELARAELSLTQNELVLTSEELEYTQAELASTQADIETTKGELADLQISYEGLIAGHGYTIKDPAYKQLMSFIKEDKTDKEQYIEDEYVCENFAMDVCNNAEKEGIRCAYVIIHYPEGGHTIVAFNTIDKGLIYIEPQSDELVNPRIGKHYYKCVVPKPGYRYEKPDYDDTIEKILVIW